VAALLDLTPDELLSTTRSVRKRLDLTRPVERGLIEECLRLAQQAPTASNAQNWAFVVVTDPEKRAALADVYRRGWEIYRTLPIAAPNMRFDDPARQAQQDRISSSAGYLAEHMHEVPALVVPCVKVRMEGMPVAAWASFMGSVLPAAWSFMLAARARGLSCAWTTIHLLLEEEAAGILGIPFGEVTQACMLPVAHTLGGTGFRPAPREPLESMVHWDGW
jgi:nitroreductase